jgi:hypothetical protein
LGFHDKGFNQRPTGSDEIAFFHFFFVVQKEFGFINSDCAVLILIKRYVGLKFLDLKLTILIAV